jgi:predicted transcriptional regulator
MVKIRSLPDAEFEIMKVVWANEPPITTNMIMKQLGNQKAWKAPTAISLLLRLVERGFLRTEKTGKERSYFPLICKEEYLQFETGNFMKFYHENSVASFVNAMSKEKELDMFDIVELMNWAKEQEK